MNPFAPALLQSLARQHGTPLWVYDAATIRARIAELRAFDTIRFAQKANSNIHLLRLMREQGVVVDAVSRGEILRALAAGFTSEVNAQGASGIVFTADLFDADDEGYAVVLVPGDLTEEQVAAAQLAADNCPEYAISVEA
mgnify:CR=1 FL=1